MKGLTFMRIEQQKRSFIDENSVEQTFPVQWINLLIEMEATTGLH